MNDLKRKLREKKAVLGVIGLGYVGLPLAVEKARAGFKTIGFDVQNKRVELVNAGVNYIGDVISEDLAALVKKGLLAATSDMEELGRVDCACICVPTPVDIYKQPDTTYIQATAESIKTHLRKGMLIVLESTTYPGTTEDLLKPILESTGLKCGEDFYLAFSPERVDPGNALYKTSNTPKVVGGVTEKCTEVAAALYESILKAPVHRVSSPAVAEMEKILENIYRHVNIGLINEMAILANRMGIDIWEVIEAAESKPYGFQAFYPGPGLGGHCIPLDPCYLSWKAREFDFHTSMIESSAMINERMPEYCVERARKILNREQKALNGSKVLVLGVAYKRDVDDYRESPAIRVIEELKKEGAEVKYFDPYVSQFQKNSLFMQSEPELNAELIGAMDLVIIATAHTKVDYELVQAQARFVFDPKNAMKEVKKRDNIELL